MDPQGFDNPVLDYEASTAPMGMMLRWFHYPG
ncbi:hypothetical protein ACVILI_000109 [Mesorhizobium sp. USDA 4775]|jgi:hypothetical protein